jgi:hypothetical protein
LIVGDSHIRECASKVKDNLNKNYSVTGMVKPGYIICTLAISALEFVHTLITNYVLLINGDMRNVGTNNATEGLRHIQIFVKRNSHTNIDLLCVPYRYDFISWSCMNDQIAMFNRKLIKEYEVSVACYSKKSDFK